MAITALDVGSMDILNAADLRLGNTTPSPDNCSSMSGDVDMLILSNYIRNLTLNNSVVAYVATELGTKI